ncbi:MAG TPA: type II CAAX endopeptidase family protein [Pyrinomonadaceae bacterium]|nr:type II CAAX endopeptidase family protein [Pyrinomonadaceae bacterium]
MNLKTVFINSVGRLRSGWRFLLFIVIYAVVFFLLVTLVRIAYAAGLRLAPGNAIGDFFQNVVYRLILLIAALGAGYVCTRWLEGLPWRALGLWFHQHWLRDLVLGSLIGVGSLALATAIATAGGGLSFAISGRAALLQVLQTLIFSAALFIVAALAEEAIFRGYGLQTLTRANLAWLGVFLTSVPFAAVHLNNPNVAAGFTFINTALAGVWLAVAYLRTRTLWFPLGVHWAWNWALGALFGLPVSGINDLAPHSLLRGTDLGPAWLTGGSYGIEGGLACTVTLIVSTMFILRTRLVAASPEMKRLTSQENPAGATVPGGEAQNA